MRLQRTALRRLSPQCQESLVLPGELYALHERRITKHQTEILQLLAEGLSMKEVAGVLELKPGTVAVHKY